MRRRTFKVAGGGGRRDGAALLLVALLTIAPACDGANGAAGGSSGATSMETARPDVPRGYVDQLLIERGGVLHRFGPFVGYYFKPEGTDDFSRVAFVCFNERGFYSSDQPVNELLFEGTGVLTDLRALSEHVPMEGGRIRPVFFDEAPDAWLATRPEPKDAFLHFHSLFTAAGPAFAGYWLKHEAKAAFTYDMGGRVGPDGPLYHAVEPGVDHRFARLIEFDFGNLNDSDAPH